MATSGDWDRDWDWDWDWGLEKEGGVSVLLTEQSPDCAGPGTGTGSGPGLLSLSRSPHFPRQMMMFWQQLQQLHLLLPLLLLGVLKSPRTSCDMDRLSPLCNQRPATRAWEWWGTRRPIAAEGAVQMLRQLAEVSSSLGDPD